MGIQKNQKTSKPKKAVSKSSNKLQKYEQTNKVIKAKKNEKGELVKDKKLGENMKNKEQQQIKNKSLNKKQKEEQDTQNDVVETFDKDGFFVLPNQMQVTQEDEAILAQFSLNNTNINEQIQETFQEELEQQKEKEYKENIMANPKIKVVYGDIANLMQTYRSGKLARAFKIIPNIDQWEEVLKLTKPENWSPQGMNAATKCFASNLDPFRARIFYENYLLPAVRKDIQKHKKLNCHYYLAIIKALYKPAAWFKGIIFPLFTDPKTTLKEAQIIGSIVAKMSIPNVHSFVALLKLSSLDYTGPTGIIMKVLIEKKYSLPLRVISSIIQYLVQFTNDSRTMPVIWHQLLLRFVQLYNPSFTQEQKISLKKLVSKKNHHLISPEILKALEGQTQQKIKENKQIEME